MNKVIVLLVVQLMLLYPSEEVSLETAGELQAENIALVSSTEENSEKQVPAKENQEQVNKEKENKEKVTHKQQIQEKNIQKRNETQPVSRQEERKKVQVFEATAYCSCVKCCGKDDGITKSGVKVHKGTLAVDPRVIPMGSKVYIEGMGWFIAEDTGNFSGNRIDIYMETHEKALQFGRQKVNVIL